MKIFVWDGTDHEYYKFFRYPLRSSRCLSCLLLMHFLSCFISKFNSTFNLLLVWISEYLVFLLIWSVWIFIWSVSYFGFMNGMEPMFYIGFTLLFFCVEMLTLYNNKKKRLYKLLILAKGPKEIEKFRMNFENKNPLLFLL